MAEDKFLLVNLEDDKSKNLANVISSDSARKILNLLSDKPLSETDIANKLNIPLPTVHYNIKQLLESDLIQIQDFLWSEKGKKMNYYKLSNKLIIITSGKTTAGFFDKLKDILPVVVLGSLASIGIYVYQYFTRVNVEPKVAAMSAPMLATASELPSAVVTSSQNYALWFFIGFISFVLLYIIINLFKKK